MPTFVECMTQQLTQRGFGKKRQKELLDRFEGLRLNYEAQGASNAEVLAAGRMWAEIIEATEIKDRLMMSNFSKVADFRTRVYEDAQVNWRGDKTPAPGRAVISFIEDDPRFAGLSYSTDREITTRRLWSIMGDVLDKIGKGAFGRQKGTAHLSNIVREVFGENTGDTIAKEVAAAWRKTADASVDMFNMAGGALKKLADWHLPQAQSAARLTREGFEKWRDFHMTALNWDRMAWPNGEPIAAADRVDVLRNVYDTLKTGGAIKIKPGAFNGRGAAVGNMIDEHRFLVYKDASSWLEMHERYGDGNVFDVMARHVEDMGHRIALVQTFGSNPQHMADTLRGIALKRAAEIDVANPAPSKERSLVSQTEAVLKNKFDPMFELITRRNPMDPDSPLGNTIVGTSNILTSAQLGAASLLAIPSDFVTTLATRIFSGTSRSPFAGVDFYFRSMIGDRAFMKEIAAQSGFVHDEAVMSNYAAQRFTGVATVGPNVTRRISDATMRLSLLQGHTTAARWSSQLEFMGLIARDAGKRFDDLNYKEVLERYGIGEAEWNDIRAIAPHQPSAGLRFLRPIDVFNTALAEDRKHELFRMFQGMIFEESRRMVPEATIEGAVMLKDTTRPDTLAGAILHSFAMYKNFPISMMMIYGRLAMTSEHIGGRLGMVAGLGAGMVAVGAMGTQMREVSKGRDPLPMNTLAFWGKALLSGGALSIWGDFLFQGVNERNRGPASIIGGPIAGLGGDTTQLLFGDVFKWADTVGTLKPEPDVKGPAKGVEFARRYTPGSSIWWARLALERQVFDRLQELADPKAYSAQRRKVQRQQKEFGNDYFWAPGDRAPARLPQYRSAN